MNKIKSRLKHKIDIQRVYPSDGQPGSKQIKTWIDAVLAETGCNQQCVVRIVDEIESAELNQQFRRKQGPTNILSFPFEWPDDIPEENPEVRYLGDLVVCAPVLEQEALEQQKNLEHHWAHIIVHGMLHLLGYDHINDDDAERMENKEIEILAKLHINNPYIEAIHS